MWKSIWDKAFGVSSLVLALLFGIALGNVIRGVNLGGVENGNSLYEAHFFFLPLWNSTFSPNGTHPGVIDWFTLLIGIISVITLTIHGANWVILKTNSSINKKLKSLVFKLTIALIIFTLISLIIWNYLNPTSFQNFIDHPGYLIFPLLFVLGIFGLFYTRTKENSMYAFISSSLVIAGGISATLAAIFPIILPSTNSINPSLTIYNTATSDYGMSVAMYWGAIGFILLFVYLIIQKKVMAGKIDDMDYGH